MFGWYTFNLVGSRIAGFWYGLYLDWKGMVQARKIWNDPYVQAGLVQLRPRHSKRDF